MGSKRLIAPIAIVVILVLIAVFWFIGQQNTLVTLEESVDAAWSEVDNQLQRRSDLIPNLVATVQGFAGQERAVYGQIADARARLAGAQTVSETHSLLARQCVDEGSLIEGLRCRCLFDGL